MAERDIQTEVAVPFFRPSITEAEIEEVVACLRSGWLTTGPRTRQFEADFSELVGAKHAVAVNSCTAALHLAVEALGLGPGQAVLVPTCTFAATAEIVRYQGAMPILVDCDPVTLNMDLADAENKLAQLKAGDLPIDSELEVVGMIPVHVGGLMMDMSAVSSFAARHSLWLVEDAAHALPAAFREAPNQPWRRAGENTASVTCYSFYANKTITTGEGGMAVTDDPDLAARIRQMSLHGLSNDAWQRFEGGAAWDYQIVAPGYKYNLTDIAAAIGIHQLERAENMRFAREKIAHQYRESFRNIDEIELPVDPQNRIHAWHLFPIRLCLDKLSINRNDFIEQLHENRVGSSVHWRPLHLHPYYENSFGWQAEQFPVATAEWQRLISLPLFPDMIEEEVAHVVRVVGDLCRRYGAGGFFAGANILFEQHEFNGSITKYDRAIELASDNAVAYNNRGVAWTVKGEFENAIADYNAAIELDPKLTTAIYNRGLVRTEMGQDEVAEGDFARVVALTPENVASHDAVVRYLTSECDGNSRDENGALLIAGCDKTLFGWKRLGPNNKARSSALLPKN